MKIRSTGKQCTGSNSGSWQKLRCKELELNCYLHANAGRIISRDELLSKAWKCQQTMTARTVDQTISSLRRKLGGDAESPCYLITAYGIGYTLGTFTSYAPESRKTARALR